VPELLLVPLEPCGQPSWQRLGARGSQPLLCRDHPAFAKTPLGEFVGWDPAGRGYDEGPGRARNPALRHTHVRRACVRRPSWSPT